MAHNDLARAIRANDQHRTELRERIASGEETTLDLRAELRDMAVVYSYLLERLPR